MLDEFNKVGGATLVDSFNRNLQRIDNETAPIIQFTDWLSSHTASVKGFFGEGNQRIWEVRQLVHALRGSQLSFYLPTFYFDLIVVDDLASGSALMDIEHIDYTSYINGTEPNKSIWIELTDGTILTRQVESSIELDADTERLTVDVVWATTITPVEISRVSLLRLVRIANDQVRFEHQYVGDADISMNVMGVQQ